MLNCVKWYFSNFDNDEGEAEHPNILEDRVWSQLLLGFQKVLLSLSV